MKTVLLVAVLSSAVGGALAADPLYPVRPLRIIVPQSAGGSTDLVARLTAQKLSESLGQSAVVDNRPGAGSIIGTDLVAKGIADGGAVPTALAVGATRERARAPN